jgi:hypothetical protein
LGPLRGAGDLYQTFKPYYDKDITIPNLIFQKNIKNPFQKIPESFQTLYKVYNVYMTPRHFSSKYGPYFVNDGFTKQNDPIPTTRVSTIDKIKAFFKSRPKKRNK